MDLTTLKFADLRLWRLARYAAAGCFLLAGAIMVTLLVGSADAAPEFGLWSKPAR